MNRSWLWGFLDSSDTSIIKVSLILESRDRWIVLIVPMILVRSLIIDLSLKWTCIPWWLFDFKSISIVHYIVIYIIFIIFFILLKIINGTSFLIDETLIWVEIQNLLICSNCNIFGSSTLWLIIVVESVYVWYFRGSILLISTVIDSILIIIIVSIIIGDMPFLIGLHSAKFK